MEEWTTLIWLRIGIGGGMLVDAVMIILKSTS